MKHYDDLIERLRKGTGLPVLQVLMNEAADAIENLVCDSDLGSIPAAEVREVKRGEWVNVAEGISYDWATCSICGARVPMASRYNGCPWCFADMRPEPPKEET